MNRLIIFAICTLKCINFFGAADDDEPTEAPTEIVDEYFKKCFDEIGCVEVNPQWHHEKFRPVNLRPVDRMIIKTDMILIKRNQTSHNDQNLLYAIITANSKSLRASEYLKNASLFLLIHDFTSNGYTGWIKHLARVLLRKKNPNVVSVDWQHGAEPSYDQAIANARVVALEENKEVDLNQIHIIGHGVGAHIAGYVGSVFGKLKKITGLDPSGPRFENMPNIVKLDSTDAKYVEILHTDAWSESSQGAKEHFGHSDFFINDAVKQPGCKKEPTISVLDLTPGYLKTGEIFPGCSHKRSFKYFIEALERSDCIFLGLKCQSHKDFAEGKCTECGNKCKSFGISTYLSPTPSAYYLNTASKSPFCLYQYKVTLQLEKFKSKYHGHFAFILIDKDDEVASSSKGEEREFVGGQNNTFIFYAGQPKLNSLIKEARVGWFGKNKGFCLFGCKNAIHVAKVYVKRLKGTSNHKEQQSILCPKDNMTEIANEDYQTFLPCKNA